jgi:glycine/D-amino acid oxidase-like deaminating enzyme
LAGIGLLLPQKVVRNTVSLTEPTRELSAPCFCGFGIGVRQRKDMSCIIAAESTSDIDVTLDVFRYAGFFMPGLFANKRAFDLSLGGALVGDVYGRIAWSKHERMVEPRAPLIRPNRRRVRKVTTRVEEVFQAVDGIKVRKSWAGNIDVLPDAIPVIDGLTGIVGLIVATGFSGHGFALGPAVGKVVAGIASGRSGDIDLARFQLDRFARGTYGSPYAPL